MAAHFINVGQGSSALFEFSCGLVLVDTGGQSQATTDWRKAFVDYLNGVFARRPDLDRRIDVLYITHPHPDHTLGIQALLDDPTIKIAHVITDAERSGQSLKQQTALVNWANQHRIPAVPINTGLITGPEGLWSRYIDPLRCKGGDPDINVLWGSYDGRAAWPKGEREDENNHSVAVRVKFGESTFLVTGDMEEIALKAMLERYSRVPRVLDVNVYVAGHHGSRNGTTPELIEAMKPEIAIMSAGNPSAMEPGYAAYNFAHPNAEAIRLLSDPTYGVSFTRPQVRVSVGVRGRNPRPGGLPPAFEDQDISKAIFATGWDGTIVVVASHDGSKRVIVE